MSVVVDGVLCDGGKEMEQGWEFFSKGLGSIGAAHIEVPDGEKGVVRHVRVYERALLVSEIIGNWRHG